MNISVHLLLSLAGAVDDIFTRHALYGADGNFGHVTPEAIAAAAAEIEQWLKANGLQVEAKVDHLIALIPLLLAAIQ